MEKTLVIIVGPTGIGKTKTAIEIAQHYNTEIISADSRQIFRELKVGTAVPTEEELKQVTHHMIGTHSIHDYYSAWEFEQDVMKLTSQLFSTKDIVVLTGGSMMYVDAVTKGIDELPTIDEDLRLSLKKQYEEEGIEHIRRQLKKLDPVFYDQVDLQNHKRVIHAVEICLMTGKPYSLLRTNSKKSRPFRMVKIGLTMDREKLYERINLRVDKMIEEGLEEETRMFYPEKELNSLNTVGYKEFFAHYNGEYDREKAIELVKRNSRRYAKKQLTWFKRDEEIQWFHPNDIQEIKDYIDQSIKN